MDTKLDSTDRTAPRMTWVPVTDGRGRTHLEARWGQTPSLGARSRVA